MKNKFKVGDRVENISACYKGMKARIVEIDKEGLPYHIKFDNNTFLWELEDHLKLIPTMKNIKDLGEKVAIQCKTQEEWDWVTKELNKKWIDPNSWRHYKAETLISATKNEYCKDTFRDEHYAIVQASDFMPLSPQDEIKELKARIATLEETLRPKEKIEFVKYLDTSFMRLETPSHSPIDFKNVMLLHKGIGNELDLMKAWDTNEPNAMIYLGHFNDGIK